MSPCHDSRKRRRQDDNEEEITRRRKEEYGENEKGLRMRDKERKWEGGRTIFRDRFKRIEGKNKLL